MPSASNCKIEFAGHSLILDPSGALFWPEQRLLIVSDLHLEKGSFFARFGSLLPRYDTHDTLIRIQQLIDLYQPEKLVCLGDSFHDGDAHARLRMQDRNLLERLILSVSAWYWILGNHDPNLNAALPGIPLSDMRIKDVMLQHEPHVDGPAQIVGHFHPKLKLKMGGVSVSGKVFAVNLQTIIMPSFGSYTGGLDVGHPALAPHLPAARYYFLYQNRIWNIGTEAITSG